MRHAAHKKKKDARIHAADNPLRSRFDISRKGKENLGDSTNRTTKLPVSRSGGSRRGGPEAGTSLNTSSAAAFPSVIVTKSRKVDAPMAERMASTVRVGRRVGPGLGGTEELINVLFGSSRNRVVVRQNVVSQQVGRTNVWENFPQNASFAPLTNITNLPRTAGATMQLPKAQFTSTDFGVRTGGFQRVEQLAEAEHTDGDI